MIRCGRRADTNTESDADKDIYPDTDIHTFTNSRWELEFLLSGKSHL